MTGGGTFRRAGVFGFAMAVGGVGMGKEDAHMSKDFKGGSKEAVCYTHDRSHYR